MYTQNPVARMLMALILWVPSLFFALRLYQFDSRIGKMTLQKASKWFLLKFYKGVIIKGTPPPLTGGLLIVANHPGAGDTLALLSSLDRSDVVIVANDRPFFRYLPNLTENLLLVPQEPEKRVHTLRSMVRNLRKGNVLVLYAAGEIEKDPFLHPDEGLAFDTWSSSIGLLVHKAKKEGFQFSIAPAITSGVLPPQTLRKADSTEEKRAVGKIIAWKAGKDTEITLLWGSTLPVGVFQNGTPLEITSKVANYAREFFFRMASRKR